MNDPVSSDSEPTHVVKRRDVTAETSDDALSASGIPPGAFPEHARYAHCGVIGRGGQGVVHRVHDRELGREVALKTLHEDRVSEATVERFLEEAEATARLEHPNIVPIYDFGRLADGRPYYTMRLVSGRSLADVLGELLRAEKEAAPAPPEWSLLRLAQVVQGVCLALQFAHERGVIHRDVKPGNILVGSHGEVLLVDWGIAKATRGRGESTRTGTVQGTYAYMSPEQARGDRLDARSDVYSTGVVLYQALALRLPHQARSDAEMVAAILRDDPQPPERSTSRAVPLELSALVMRALAKRPEDRLASARELHDELQSFLEGLRDRAKKLETAEVLRTAGDVSLRRHEALVGEVESLRKDIGRLEAAHPAWQPIPEKRLLLDARRLLESLEERARAEFLEAVRHFTDVLAYAPDHREARRALTDVFWRRFTEAEHAMDRSLAQAYRSLVERFHDGRLTRELEGRGSLRLSVSPAHAELTLHPLVERDLVLADGPGRALGRGDVEIPDIEMGSYVIVARAKDHVAARYPVCIVRNTEWVGTLRLLEGGSLPEGMIHVPGAEAWLGGDGKATNAWPLRRVAVRSFAMARHPLTFGEWCDFLDAQAEQGARVDDLVPRTEVDGAFCTRDGSGRFVPLARGDRTNLEARFGAGAERRVPVVAVDDECAARYVAWRSQRDAVSYRLPTAEEWEFVGRGVDRRTYPWGNAFDATLAHLRDSFEGQPEIGPVGAFATDRSVHGVQDLAGCIHERTASWFDEGKQMLEVRGGSWHVGGTAARVGFRGGVHAKARSESLGLRLAMDVGDD